MGPKQPFAYAKLPDFSYQRIDHLPLQYTNVPVWRESSPPPSEPDVVPPQAAADSGSKDAPSEEGGKPENAGKHRRRGSKQLWLGY